MRIVGKFRRFAKGKTRAAALNAIIINLVEDNLSGGVLSHIRDDCVMRQGNTLGGLVQ